MAPRQRGVQRLLAGDGGAAAATKDPQGVVEAGGDLGGRQGRCPRRGQLQGQWHPVQPDADLGHRGRRRRVEHEPWRRVTRPLDEEPDRLQLGQAGEGRQGLQIWERERRRAPGHLAAHAQRLAAGRQDDNVGAGAQQGGGEPGARVQEMLAVVQDDQQPPLGQLPGQRDLGRPRLGQRHVQHRRDRLRHQLGTRERRQLDDVDAVGIAVGQPGRDLVGQPGLAGAAGAGQGEQSRAAERLADLGKLAPAADEGRLLRPQAFRDARRRASRYAGDGPPRRRDPTCRRRVRLGAADG